MIQKKIRARQEEERDATQSQQKQPKRAGRPGASEISGARENGAVKGPPHVRGKRNDEAKARGDKLTKEERTTETNPPSGPCSFIKVKEITTKLRTSRFTFFMILVKHYSRRFGCFLTRNFLDLFVCLIF
jgi:hypothetical protein